VHLFFKDTTCLFLPFYGNETSAKKIPAPPTSLYNDCDWLQNKTQMCCYMFVRTISQNRFWCFKINWSGFKVNKTGI